MKIADVNIISSVMPREDSEWRFALGGTDRYYGFIIKLTTNDGLIGFGYTNASAHFGVTKGGIQAALEAYAEPLKGQDPFDTEKIFATLNMILHENNEAKTAIDMALYDLQAKALGLPLYALLGGLFRAEIPIIRIVPLKEPSQMAANALNLVEQGYRYIKVKLHGEPAKDLERIKEIRKAVGNDIHITVDMNQSYSPKVAIDTIKRMEEYRVELCEQPVRADDWQGLAAVTRAVDCVVEAHESARTVENIFDLVKNGVVDSINITIRQLGGLRNAKIAASLCKLGNVDLRVQSFGSRLLAAASMHFVSSTENISSACELGEFAGLLNDPFEGLEVEDGKLKVPSTPGIGVSLRS